MSSGRGYGAMHERREREQVDDLTLSDGLIEALSQRLAEYDDTQIGFMDWAKRVPEPKSGTLDFDRFPFQRELYEETASEREVVIVKATQVGVSAYLLRWTLFWADRGLTALYVFPKLQQLYDFSDSRIKPVILRSEYLRERVPGANVQNKGLKQIGLGWVYYRGSESKPGLDSVDADVLALDEYDTLTQANIPDAERRITGALRGLIRRVGVPTIPDWGISRLYDLTDRRRWHVKCGCGEWQYLTFLENVDQARCLIVCRKCMKPLDVASGQWVAEFPDRDARGYHVPRLVVPGVDLEKIIEASKATEPYKKQVFHNKDLGDPYAPEEGRLSPQAIAAAQREYMMAPKDGGYRGDNLVTMGVDVASARPLSVRISEHVSDRRKRALWIGMCDNFDELGNMMERFNVKMCAVDHLPDMRLARSFAERYAGRVLLVNYKTSNIASDVLTAEPEQRRCAVRRVEAIDAAMEMIRQQRNELPAVLPENYAMELMANVRLVDHDELGKMTVVYRATAADDYLHAEVYDIVATELWWMQQAQAEAAREVFQPLDNMMEFQRSDVNDPDAMDYRPGPGGEDYSPGYDPD